MRWNLCNQCKAELQNNNRSSLPKGRSNNEEVQKAASMKKKKNDFFPLNENIRAWSLKKIKKNIPFHSVQLLFVGIIYVEHKLRLWASYVIIL